MPKIERAPSLVSTARAQAVSRAAPEIATTPQGPVTDYAGQAAAPKNLLPKGANVSTSASPSALWGDAPAQADLEPAEFAKLSAADQQKTLGSLRAERGQLGGEIVQRVERLDQKWGNARLSTRTEALREYHDQSRRLDPGSRRRLDGFVRRSEDSQRKINGLRVKIDRLPKTPEAKKAQVALRNQLARELAAARSEQSKVVKSATEVIDEKGLKADRLAVTEQIIDPAAPAQGSGDSLLDKIGRFLKLDWLISAFTDIARAQLSEYGKSVEQMGQRYAEEDKIKRANRRAEDDQKVARAALEAADRAGEAPDDAVVLRARAVLAPLIAPRTAAASPASGA